MLLSGCASYQDTDPALQLRQQLQNSTCSFIAEITADYGDEIYTFSLNCSMETDGTVRFAVVKPESICDITGSMSGSGGAITFDDQVLAFPMLADGQVSPVSAPYLLIKTLRSGYIRSCGEDGDLWKLQINDSYQDQALELDIWVTKDLQPVHCDILYAGRRYLSLVIDDFQFL